MSGFSRTEIDFFRSQFQRYDSPRKNELNIDQTTNAVNASWRIAGLPRQPTVDEVRAVFDYVQNGNKVTASQFVSLLQTLKRNVSSSGQAGDGGNWRSTLKRGSVTTIKKVGRFFGVTDERAEGAPSNMQLWEYKTKERVSESGIGPSFRRGSSLHGAYRSDDVQLQMMDPTYDNRPRRSTSPDSNASSDEYHSDGEDIRPRLPPKKKRQQRAQKPQAAGALASSSTSGEFIRDPNEALAYYRRRVKEEAEEAAKKEEWFGFDQAALLRSDSHDNNSKKKKGKDEVDTFVRMQLESLPQFFPVFIILISVGQVVAMGVTAYLGGFAPIGLGVDVKNETFSSLVPPYTAHYTHTVAKNMWIGPDGRYLIHVGAKFTPCMREDSKIYAGYARKFEEESGEGGYGCCIIERESYRAGGYTTSDRCNNDYKGTFQIGEKCSEYIVRTGDNILIEFRPCCATITGDCLLTSPDLCEFYEGKYHADAESCKEVNCLSDVCGMGGLKADVNNTYQPDNPNQWWRFITPLVFHLGFIHLTLVVVFQLFVGWSIEKTAGWLRVFLIYFISGVGGYIISGIFIPYMPVAGASPAAFGLLAVLVIELFQTWQIVKRKAFELIKLLVIVLLFLMIGTLPYVDNFAQLGGFCFGLVAGIIFLPYITFGKWDARRKKILVIIAVPALFVMFVISLVIFYHVQNTQTFCPNCKYVNCIPYTSTICDDALASPDPENVPL